MSSPGTTFTAEFECPVDQLVPHPVGGQLS